VFLRRPLFHRLLRIAMAIAAALATMIARTGDLPPAAGLPGSGAAFQMKLLIC
jgi:hypothetical protein